MGAAPAAAFLLGFNMAVASAICASIPSLLSNRQPLAAASDRVRAWRLVLAPGRSAAAITQRAPGMRIVVDGGEISESVPGAAERGWGLRTGEFFWQDPGVTRATKDPPGGVIVQPVRGVSFYASYATSYVPQTAASHA